MKVKNHPTLTIMLLTICLIIGFPNTIGAEPASTLPEVYADLEQLDKTLRQEILPAILFHHEMVDTFSPLLQDKFTRDWNGITLKNGEPNWIKPTAWNGYWDLRAATTLFSGDPEKDTYWPLIDNPGLIEKITMDLQYLEGCNYTVSPQGIYTDTLISVYFDWFAALYSKNYSTLITLAEKIVDVYVLQHNLSALLEDDGNFLSYEIIPDNPGASGKVSFQEQPLLGYPNLTASLRATANKNYAQRLASAAGESEEPITEQDPENPDTKEPEPETSEDPDTNNPEQTEDIDESSDKLPVDPGSNLLVIILWPLTLAGASGAAFWLGRRK